jgi:hypothetical protein
VVPLVSPSTKNAVPITLIVALANIAILPTWLPTTSVITMNVQPSLISAARLFLTAVLPTMIALLATLAPVANAHPIVTPVRAVTLAATPLVFVKR